MSKMKKIATIRELIPVTTQKIEQNSVQTVNARAVWEFLGVKAEFANWIQQKIKRYDFIEGQDYARCTNSRTERAIGSEHKIEYFMHIDSIIAIVRGSRNNKVPELYEFLLNISCNREVLIRERSRDEIIFGESLKTILNNISNIIEQYQVVEYRIDFYLPEYNLAIEYNEKHHNSLFNKIKDQKRIENIKKIIEAKFIIVDQYEENKGINKIIQYIINQNVHTLIGKSPIFDHRIEDKNILVNAR